MTEYSNPKPQRHGGKQRYVVTVSLNPPYRLQDSPELADIPKSWSIYSRRGGDGSRTITVTAEQYFCLQIMDKHDMIVGTIAAHKEDTNNDTPK